MSFEKVLIIEDESVVRNLLNEIFLRRKCAVATAKTLAEAEALIARESFDLILLDIRLPDGDGQKFLEQLALLPERPLVIVVTGYGSIESAVACMRAGAFDYVMKPFSPSQIDVILQEGPGLPPAAPGQPAPERLGRRRRRRLCSGAAPPWSRLRQLIERVAPTDATVFISGESGTGKEMIAREIYRRSPRRQQPFIKVNCAAISENLIESEFFGHERGAFTGATERREGRFELANHGTLLLDEVSEIPREPAGQAPAGPPGAGVRAGGRQPDDQGQRPDPGDLQPGPAAERRAGPVPAGPLLPAQRLPGARSRRCATGRRTSSSWPSTSWRATPASTASRSTGFAESASTRCSTTVAGQRPGAAERDRAGGHPLGGRAGRSRPPPSGCRPAAYQAELTLDAAASPGPSSRPPNSRTAGRWRSDPERRRDPADGCRTAPSSRSPSSRSRPSGPPSSRPAATGPRPRRLLGHQHPDPAEQASGVPRRERPRFHGPGRGKGLTASGWASSG